MFFEKIFLKNLISFKNDEKGDQKSKFRKYR